LKSPESDERIQGNPRKSKRYFLGYAWISLEKLGRKAPLFSESAKAIRRTSVAGDRIMARALS
jgi:hypothetical protein